ncbi:Rho termination factor N-terminal domain-containing protein [Micromonospora sp. NPDC049836]|uniref:Rho termination factor N-terminal domain-containing protein n=1 Tax=Micromonospora sp. NPDC049836 TaxID=3364274 RepID=UPI0037BCF0C6
MTGPTRAVRARVAEFLAGLSAADLAALEDGRARLAVVPVAEAPPPARAASPGRPGTSPADEPAGGAPARRAAVAPSGADTERAYAALAAMSRRDDGAAYLSSWTTRELRALAARAGLRGVSGLRKTDLVERIVDRTIGFRLDSTAIRRR